MIGAGVFGLWVALEGVRAGLRVTIADRERPGAGASGGVVGALIPHIPVRWRPLKQAQLDGLLCLEAETERLTVETGRPTGYRRCGRVSPLADAAARERALEHRQAAADIWAGAARLDVLDRLPPAIEGLVAPELFPAGAVADSLTARITPSLYLDALVAALASRAEILSGWEAREIDAATGRVRFPGGDITARHTVVAAGWRSFPLAPVCQGKGVKGQAAVLSATLPADMPVLQMPDLYVVAHGRGQVAVGSTSENAWQHEAPDAGLDAVIARARAVCPALREAPVAARWAGVRPKAPRGDPMVGPVPGSERLWIATGGFKIGFALAHVLAKGLIARITGGQTAYPLHPDFAPKPVD